MSYVDLGKGGPLEAFFEQTWKPDDLVKIGQLNTFGDKRTIRTVSPRSLWNRGLPGDDSCYRKPIQLNLALLLPCEIRQALLQRGEGLNIAPRT